MKSRILNGWNFQRALFVIMGLLVLIQCATQGEWMGILLGAYFASIGIFALGCAGGNCFGNACKIRPGRQNEDRDMKGHKDIKPN